MNGKLVLLGMMLIMFGAISFAAPSISWAINTPGNNSNYSGDETMFNMTSNETMNASGNWIEIDSVNYTCTPSADKLSCNRTLGYTDKIYNHTYSVIGYANVSGTQYPSATRIVNYYGCGFVNNNSVLLYDIGSENYTQTCLTINASSITLDGNAKSVTVDNSTSGISSATKTGITIEEVEVVGGSWGVLFLDTNNSVIDDIQVFGIPGTNVGIFFGDSNNNNITGSYIEGCGYGISLSSSSNYNNVSLNEITDNAVGIIASDIGNILDSNEIHLNTGDGIILTAITDTAIDRNEIFDNPIGVQASNSNLSVFWKNHYYNNSVVDYYMSNTNNVSYLNFIIQDTYSAPSGSYVNSTKISALDYVLYNDSYSISWASFGTVPTNMSVFSGKAISLDDGVLSSDAILDEFVIYWNSTESSGYNESLFSLWREVFPGTFTLMNDSPNTGGNYIMMYDTNISGWGRYGILYNTSTGQVVPPVPGNVTDAETLVIISQFISVALIFIVLFIIVSSFGLQKWFDFKDMFVPLMVGALLIILAIGLFL